MIQNWAALLVVMIGTGVMSLVGVIFIICPTGLVGFQKNMIELFRGGTYIPDRGTVIRIRIGGIVIIAMAIVFIFITVFS